MRARSFPNRHPGRLGGLRLHERFAVGASSSVCFGWLSRRATLVAVKRMHPFHVTSGASARVDHPNVVSMFGVVRRENELLAAMEYVPGASLAEIAGAAPTGLAPRIAARIAADVMHGVHAAHEARCGLVLPRGLSKASVIVGEDGWTRVLDLDVRGPATAAALVEKLPYASPEEVLHHDDTLDRRRDVYSASVVLWETLTGRPLFRTPSVAGTLDAILWKEVLPPSRFAASVDPKIDAIVLRGLARDRSHRWRSALEMAHELERTTCATHDEISRAVDDLDLACIRQRRGLATLVKVRESRPVHIECTGGVSKE